MLVELKERTEDIHKVVIEDNKFCVSVHYRHVKDDQEYDRLEEEVKRVLINYPQFHMTRGKKVLEIRPSIEWNKGHALEYLLRNLGFDDSRNLLPIYIGDDTTDEDAFKAMRMQRWLSRKPADSLDDHHVLDDQNYTCWLKEHPSAISSFQRMMDASKGKQIAVFLDYDGTLSPIVSDPDRAFMSDQMRAAVRDVSKHFPTAIISGRSREKVYSFVKLNEVYYSGSHGMDTMGPPPKTKSCDETYHYKTTDEEDYNHLIEAASSVVVSEYDLGGEGDLFKAPQPIIQQPLDPACITIISDTFSQHQLEVAADIQKEEFLNDVFNECKNLLPKEAAPPGTGTGTEIESSPLSQVISFSFPDEIPVHSTSSQIPKSMSSDSLSSMDWIQLKSNFLNFTEIDFGMRRAFSEGDIKTLSDANTSVNCYPLRQPQVMTEDRMQKLSRYRNKKTKRNFGRKIKYACRKALADSQPRIRGRFAKTDTS
ncbi:hypothetical protein M8C21_012951 [Ambrosia artemisiifolia]|uniref:Trehalose 6-phosphate phosphatase n=1 Tax=Ambrosia artemisiifolia TaxID=4212 RepID=A0AAD5CVC1_AMBAR|nr:hypothetical protein M8C21_012951 [Ambrosia artemisiifolia]